MNLDITYKKPGGQSPNVSLPSSKSISNRLLIIDALSGFQSDIQNLSTARDTKLMLELLNSTKTIKNAKDAGTTYRFLTSYLSLKDGQINILEGEERMYARPIGILVDALKELGAEIEYLKEAGFPPLKITGKQLISQGPISISGSVSSQFISSLLLIGPHIKNGLVLKLIPPVASEPYITMTINLMQAFGAEIKYEQNIISISEKKYTPRPFKVESDWSGACFMYTLAAATSSEILLSNLTDESLQADRAIADIMSKIGITSTFTDAGTIIQGHHNKIKSALIIDCHAFPDLVPAFVVTLGILGIPATLTSVEHLRYKESDRILALQTEMAKVGVTVKSEPDIIHISGQAKVKRETIFDSYRDHRMAMCFAIFGTQAQIQIRDAEVVEKSFPEYWDVLKKLGFIISKSI